MRLIIEHWQAISSLIGTIGGMLGAWALLRSVWRERSHLNVIQKRDKEYTEFKEIAPCNGRLTLTVLISNLSSRPNSVVQFEAAMLKTDGEYQALLADHRTAWRGLGTGHATGTEYCVTPVNVPPHSTTESLLKFYDIDKRLYRQPLTLKITAVDMHGKRFVGHVTVEVPERKVEASTY
jgi:hypothetical protein